MRQAHRAAEGGRHAAARAARACAAEGGVRPAAGSVGTGALGVGIGAGADGVETAPPPLVAEARVPAWQPAPARAIRTASTAAHRTRPVRSTSVTPEV